MTNQPISRDELAAARRALLQEIVVNMPRAHKDFFVSFERGNPGWTLLDTPGAAELPAIKWRQHNLDKLSADRRAELVANLEKILFRNA